MDMQTVSNLEIAEGEVRTIHDSNNAQIWGKVAFDTKYSGDTYQQTYSGKNLYAFNAMSQRRYGIDFGGSGTRMTFNNTSTGNVFGQTYFNMNGIDWASANYANYDATASGLTLPAGTYTISLHNFSGSFASNYAVYVRVCKTSTTVPNSTLATIDLKTSATSATFTLAQETTIKVQFVVALPSEGTMPTFNLYSFDVQIEQGSEATSFEPYTGGIPVPNPDFEEPIYTVTGEQSVMVTGKNLFDKAYVTTGYLVRRDTGALAENNNFCASDFIPVTAGMQYRFGQGFDYWYTAIYDQNKQYIGFPENSTTITIPKGGAYIRTSVYASRLDEAQLELGSTATSYEPYQGVNYKVNLGKNLIQIVGTTSNGLTSSNQGGILEVTGEASDNWAFIVPETSSILFAGKYTISIDNSLSHSVDVRFYFSDGTNETYAIGAGNTTATFTTTKTANKYAVLFGGITSGQEYDETIKLQLELGSTATTYAPYFTPIELCKIGDHEDYIYKSGDDWYVHKETGKIVLNGTESWDRIPYTSTQVYYRWFNSSISTEDGFCNYLDVVPTSSSIVNVENSIRANGNFIGIRFTPSFQPSIDDFKTWLSNNNVLFYYTIATPTDTKITDNTLISQLEAIHQWLTRYGYNSSVVGSLPMIINKTPL